MRASKIPGGRWQRELGWLTALCLLFSPPASAGEAAPESAPAASCRPGHELWVSGPLLEKLSADGIQKAVNRFASEVTDPKNTMHSVRLALGGVSAKSEMKFPGFLLAEEDKPPNAPFLIPSQFHAGNLDIPTLRFGRPEIAAQSGPDGKPREGHYRVRVPVEQLDLTMDVGLESRIAGQKPATLFGVQGLRVSLDHEKAPNDPPPYIEYDVELKPGQTLADAIRIQSRSGKFHLPASQLDVGVKIRPGDEKRREAYEQVMQSPELQAFAARIEKVRSAQELERLLSSDELRGLEARSPGIGEHFSRFVKQGCDSLGWKGDEATLSQFLLLREIQMKLSLDVLKPQVANRSSLEAIWLMRMGAGLAGKVEETERRRIAAGEKPRIPKLGEEGATPVYDGIPGIYPILNDQVAPLLSEKLAAVIQESSLAQPILTSIPGMTPARMLQAGTSPRARPFTPPNRDFEIRNWALAGPALGGVEASVSRCGGSDESSHAEGWLDPPLAARLASSQSAAVGVRIEEVNHYLAEAFSEKSQNVVEFRNRDANRELEKQKKEAKRQGLPEPEGELKTPDLNIRLAFKRPPRLVVEKDPKTGQKALYLDVDLREHRGGILGFLSGGTRFDSKVRLYQDENGMIRMDATKTGQKVDLSSLSGVVDSLLQVVTGRRAIKSAVLHGKVIPALNQSVQISPELGDWRVSALEPSSDGSRVILGLQSAQPGTTP